VLIDGIRELGPDLIGFQETIVNEEYDQVADLLGPGFHVAHQTAREIVGPTSRMDRGSRSPAAGRCETCESSTST
jgi:hypothetical protein